MDSNEKLSCYTKLVASRKSCRICDPLKMQNHAIIAGGLFDSNHIGPWTGWQGNLHSDLMVVGQDWGGAAYFVKHKGIEDDDNPTNVRLCFLLNSIGVKIDLPRQSRGVGTAFFTNAVLCSKPGGLIGQSCRSVLKTADRHFFALKSKL